MKAYVINAINVYMFIRLYVLFLGSSALWSERVLRILFASEVYQRILPTTSQ